MARRRMVVAFAEVETPMDRQFRHGMAGVTVDQMLAEPRPMRKTFHDGGYTPEGRVRVWCAADKPQTDDTFMVGPVYRTEALEWSDDVRCEDCGIEINALARELTKHLA